jgi:putative membrane protein
MILDAFLAWLHYVSIFATAFFLLLEWVRCREPIALNRSRLLVKMDAAYALSALSALGSGLLRLFYGAKGSAFYLDNPIFYVKVGVYLVVALLSIPVTVSFFRWKKSLEKAHGEVTVPTSDIRFVRGFLLAELIVLALLPVLAVLMARGFGITH